MGTTTLQRREVYAGRVVRLALDEVRFPDGKTAEREVVVHPGAVAMLPVLPDGSLVLLEQYRHPTGGTIWEIPAGTLEPDESPTACAARELIEETGYAADRLVPLGTFWTAPGFCTELMHLYLATDLQEAEQALEHDEHIDVHVFPEAEVAAMVADGRIADAKTLVGWYRYLAWRRGDPVPPAAAS